MTPKPAQHHSGRARIYVIIWNKLLGRKEQTGVLWEIPQVAYDRIQQEFLRHHTITEHMLDTTGTREWMIS